VKDLQTRSVIARCNSTGDLYPFFPPAPPRTTALTAAASSTLWHCRLGHVVMRLCPSSLVPMLFHVISAMTLMFATLVSSVAMCSSLLACQTLVHFAHLI
jgi:hypothetical protein